jgi:uncharacterized protein involved in exopolysaccharide biosynthesis
MVMSQETGRSRAGGGFLDKGPGASSGRDLALFIFKHMRLLLTLILGVSGLVAVLTYLVPPEYAATALILVERIKSPILRSDPLGANVQGDEVMGSEIELVTSRTVSEAAVDKLQLDKRPVSDTFFRRLKDRVETALDDYGLLVKLPRRERLIRGIPDDMKVKQPGVSNLLDVTYYGDSPEEAEEMARAITEAYLEAHRRVYSNNSATFFQARLEESQRALARVQGTLGRENDRVRLKELELQEKALEASFLFYSERVNRARADEVADVSLVNVRVVDWPVVPLRPRFSRLLLIAIGVAVGVAFAAAVALIREYLDHTVYSAEDARPHIDVPVLGSVQYVGFIGRRRVLGGEP